MKYKYRLIIEDVGKDEEILVLSGVGSTRSKETCLKGIRREITQTIREMLGNKETDTIKPFKSESPISKNS